ncbi:MAG: hypothetical protein Q9191_007814 [Dirinaria sp. TL-2023a]
MIQLRKRFKLFSESFNSHDEIRQNAHGHEKTILISNEEGRLRYLIIMRNIQLLEQKGIEDDVYLIRKKVKTDLSSRYKLDDIVSQSKEISMSKVTMSFKRKQPTLESERVPFESSQAASSVLSETTANTIISLTKKVKLVSLKIIITLTSKKTDIVILDDDLSELSVSKPKLTFSQLKGMRAIFQRARDHAQENKINLLTIFHAADALQTNLSVETTLRMIEQLRDRYVDERSMMTHEKKTEREYE